MTTDLIAAVARLREWINLSPETQAMLDMDCVLSALDAAQADARQATETLTQIRNST